MTIAAEIERGKLSWMWAKSFNGTHLPIWCNFTTRSYWRRIFSCVFIILREFFFLQFVLFKNSMYVWENIAWTYLTSPLCAAKWANIVSCIDGKMANSTPLMSTPMPSNTKLSGPRGLKYLHRHSFLAKSFRQIFKRAFLKSFNSLPQQCIIYAFCTSCRFQEDFTFLS